MSWEDVFSKHWKPRAEMEDERRRLKDLEARRMISLDQYNKLRRIDDVGFYRRHQQYVFVGVDDSSKNKRYLTSRLIT